MFVCLSVLITLNTLCHLVKVVGAGGLEEARSLSPTSSYSFIYGYCLVLHTNIKYSKFS